MKSEGNEILVPIKDIVVNSIEKNKTVIQEDEINLLRKYFIAGLNLGFFKPDALISLMDKFSNNIKAVDVVFNNDTDIYVIKDNKLTLFKTYNEDTPDTYAISFFKAVSEVLLDFGQQAPCSLVNGICEMVAEKIYYMDEKGQPIIFPDLKIEYICGKTLELRSGYYRDVLLITLLKQFFILHDFNETKIFAELFLKSGKDVLLRFYDTNNKKLLIDILDAIYLTSQKRLLNKKNIDYEIDLIEKYQFYINSLFDRGRASYLLFSALITSSDLRDKCIKWHEDH